MALRKKNAFLALANSYLIDSPQPSTISYWWNIGSLLGLCLVIQLGTGIFLAMHYSSNLELAFISVEHIMRDVSSGWALRYCHANGAAFFFILIYAHMARGLYYGSYKSPRVALWVIGVIIFLLLIITGFLGFDKHSPKSNHIKTSYNINRKLLFNHHQIRSYSTSSRNNDNKNDSVEKLFKELNIKPIMYFDDLGNSENHRDIKNKFGFNIKEVGIDSGYDTLDIKKYLHDNNIFGVIAYRRYAKAETTIKKNRFKYLKESDCYVCPETGVILEYTGRIDRNGYKFYSSKENCSGCPQARGCCNKKEYRTITRHICEELNEEMRERRLSDRGKTLYKQRKEHVERSFADSKNNHGYRYAMYRGIEKNQNYTWLICAAQNMKNIAIKKEKVWAWVPYFNLFYQNFSKK